jgi:hypothetical protein
MVDSTPISNLSLKENLFSFFAENPEIKFKNQADDEETILFLRSHPATQIPWILNSFICIIGILFLNSFLRDYFSLRQILFVDIFFSAMLFSYIFMNFLNWIFNVDIVTNKRVIDIDFPAFLCREMNIASLNSIEDTSSKTTGFLSSWFDYGDVFIQTAASEQDIEFMGVPKPTDIIYTINSLIKRTNGHRRDR